MPFGDITVVNSIIVFHQVSQLLFNSSDFIVRTTAWSEILLNIPELIHHGRVVSVFNHPFGLFSNQMLLEFREDPFLESVVVVGLCFYHVHIGYYSHQVIVLTLLLV